MTMMMMMHEGKEDRRGEERFGMFCYYTSHVLCYLLLCCVLSILVLKCSICNLYFYCIMCTYYSNQYSEISNRIQLCYYYIYGSHSIFQPRPGNVVYNMYIVMITSPRTITHVADVYMYVGYG
jgi:hypothetical protein